MSKYQQHEKFCSNFKIYLRMFKRALKIGLSVQLLLLGYIAYSFCISIAGTTIHDPISGNDTRIKVPVLATIKYFNSYIRQDENNTNRVEDELYPYALGAEMLPDPWYCVLIDAVTQMRYADAAQKFVHGFRISFASYALTIVYLAYFLTRDAKQKKERYIRGAKMTPSGVFQKTVNDKATTLLALKIGKLKIPWEMEPKHMLILGSAGCGKGVLTNQMIAQINTRKKKCQTADRLIIYDPKGEFVAKQFASGDIIFNPFDARSIGWNILNEVSIEPDLDIIAQSLFATSDLTNQYFYDCAADVFRAGLVYLIKNNRKSNEELWNFFAKPTEDLIDAFHTLPPGERGAIKHISASDGGAAASVMSVLQQRIKAFRYLVNMDSDFSFRKFIREGGNQNLFILNANQNFAEIFKPILTLVIDLMTREALSLPDDPNRRLFFIIDELGMLDKMPSVLDLLTVGRSKGVSMICINQDLGRIEEKYGKSNLKTFFNNFNTNFTFRMCDPDTTKFLSAAIGDQQSIKMTENVETTKEGRSFSEQEKNRSIDSAGRISRFGTVRSIHFHGGGWCVENQNTSGILSREISSVRFTRI